MASGAPPRCRVAGDVWDLLREDALALRVVLGTVPAQGLLMIVSGSPCRQLTTACPTRGIVGLCGHGSYLFYAVPAVAWVSQRLRPDISVRADWCRDATGSARVPVGRRMGTKVGWPPPHHDEEQGRRRRANQGLNLSVPAPVPTL